MNSLFWNFISFPRKSRYSASFLHWIFSLSYLYLTNLYIFNSVVSWTLKPSSLWIPWICRGWTLANAHHNSRGEQSSLLQLETRPDSPGEPWMQPRDPYATGEEHGVSGHKPRWGLFALQWLESKPQLPLATRMEIGLPWDNTRGSLSSPL